MKQLLTIGVVCAVTAAGSVAMASSHREAPFITQNPKVDATDFYMFSSYETGREGFVTLIANYIPLQDAYGGPNYFAMDPNARYEIHIDNDGDAREDLTFRFEFDNLIQGVALDIGGESVAIPLIQAGEIGPLAADTSALNVVEQYKVSLKRDRNGLSGMQSITDAVSASATFIKPVDNIGEKTIPDYAGYANDHIYDIAIPGCSNGRMFVGQRRDGFVVNLGETFDLINTNPLGAVDGEANTLDDKNVTTLALEVPISCLTSGSDPVIGAWTTASVPQVRILRPFPKDSGAALERGAYTQISRLGMPLVNEVVIGLPDKDKFNASKPWSDGNFATYVTNPTLPALIELLFGVEAPTLFPREDLIQVFLTGVPGLNQPAQVTASEMLRLNTAIAPVSAPEQMTMGVLAGDLAGFPNGRRPGDDVVDAALRVVMGVLLSEDDAPAGQLPYTDGAAIDASMFDTTFPYLVTPLPGSPNEGGAE